jgi:hypothetical protein
MGYFCGIFHLFSGSAPEYAHKEENMSYWAVRCVCKTTTYCFIWTGLLVPIEILNFVKREKPRLFVFSKHTQQKYAKFCNIGHCFINRNFKTPY